MASLCFPGLTADAWSRILRVPTLATSHLMSPSTVASDAESHKSLKYRGLASIYYFVPVAVETLGALDEKASAFFCDLGPRIAAVTSEPRSYQLLLQWLSVVVHRGNAACVLRTVPATNELYDLFYL